MLVSLLLVLNFLRFFVYYDQRSRRGEVKINCKIKNHEFECFFLFLRSIAGNPFSLIRLSRLLLTQAYMCGEDCETLEALHRILRVFVQLKLIKLSSSK